MNRIPLGLIVVVALTICRCTTATDESAKLTVQLRNTGFHRELVYQTVFPNHQTEPRTFVIKQIIPAAAYVSTDQLEDLIRFDKISYHVDDVLIDIEKPTEASEPFRIYLFGKTNQTQPITLPIHFRYHAPGKKSFVSVNIDLPQIYVEWNKQVDELSNGTESSIYSITCPDRRHRCRWLRMEFDNYSKRPLSASIPIGNAGVKGVVTFVTIALSWVAAVFIILVVRKKNQILKIKLKLN